MFSFLSSNTNTNRSCPPSNFTELRFGDLVIIIMCDCHGLLTVDGCFVKIVENDVDGQPFQFSSSPSPSPRNRGFSSRILGCAGSRLRARR